MLFGNYDQVRLYATDDNEILNYDHFTSWVEKRLITNH